MQAIATTSGSDRDSPSSPRVLIDASCLKREQGGIRSYTLGLTRSLARGGAAVSIATPFPRDFDSDISEITVHTIASDVSQPSRRALWRETRLRNLARVYRADVVIIPLHEQPLRAFDVPTVMVMHDLGPLVAPAIYGRTRWARYLLTLPHAIKVASAIVSMSHATQADLYGNFRLDLDKCRVIETGTQSLPDPQGSSAPVEGDYALYVGALLPHKNAETLIRAFAADDGRLPAHLVLVGPHTDDERRQITLWMDQYGVASERVLQLGYVDARILSALYRAASVCVLPSLHEGFGAPLVEAMRLGIPFVASDIPAHREVARDAAVFVSELLSPVAWRNAMGDAYRDEGLRQALARTGPERAAYYTWDRVGSEWMLLLRSLTSRDG